MKKVSEKKSVLNKNAAIVKKETNAKPTPAATKKKTAKTEEKAAPVKKSESTIR